MKRYEFYRNQKITVIDCRYFSFEAENLETAVQKIKELCALKQFMQAFQEVIT